MRTEQIMQQYVSGINCTPATARNEMMAVKKRYGKDEGIVAFHGYQSFAPGECTPALAHEIGVRLAQELWGGRFQVLVATHLDKAHIFITISWSILFPILTGNGITEQIRIIGICERSLTGSAGSTVCP